MKLIIDIPDETYKEVIEGKDTSNTNIYKAIENGIPLDDVKDIIRDKKMAETDVAREYYNLGLGDAINILDYVGKAESEDKE